MTVKVFLPILFDRIEWEKSKTEEKNPEKISKKEDLLELVSKELNHLAAILHVYAGGLNFMK